MMRIKRIGMTLIELLIVVVLLSLISLGFFNLHIFSQEQVFQADKRSKVQNEISFVLEHMTKQVKGRAFGVGNIRGGVIGNMTDTVNLPVTLVPAAPPHTQIRFLIDFNGNGRLDPPGVGDTDKIIVYEYDNHSIRFYPNFTDNPTTFETLTNQAVILGPFNEGGIPSRIDYTLGDNFFAITLGGCWDPGAVLTMPVLENPQVIMTATISMPSVGVN